MFSVWCFRSHCYICRFTQSAEAVAITQAPTRFGQVNFTLQPTKSAEGPRIRGSVSILLRAAAPIPAISVRLPSVAAAPYGCVSVAGEARLVAWNKTTETALVALTPGNPLAPFSFAVSAPC